MKFEVVRMVEINFLCVHKKLRSKRVAPVYWHRSLNPKKLIEVKFSHLSRKMTMQRTLKLFRLPQAPKTPGLVALQKCDIDGAFKLLTDYLKKFALVPKFTRDDFEHFFTPKADVIYTYVVRVIF
uniref:Glycylpeptide N-tetradecanoyltransferase n=1 Tax=Parascaris equorum TaxID=6256 RepID=A0A914RUM6_PAREQ